jgi:hypothetical protein
VLDLERNGNDGEDRLKRAGDIDRDATLPLAPEAPSPHSHDENKSHPRLASAHDHAYPLLPSISFLLFLFVWH